MERELHLAGSIVTSNYPAPLIATAPECQPMITAGGSHAIRAAKPGNKQRESSTRRAIISDMEVTALMMAITHRAKRQPQT